MNYSGFCLLSQLGYVRHFIFYTLVATQEQLYELHAACGTLETPKDSISKLCPNCRNRSTCVEWDKVEELTCFCMESVFWLMMKHYAVL